MREDLKANILSPSHWLRVLYMLFFAVVCWLLGIILTVLVVAQALFSLLSGRDNENLRQLGGNLSFYFYQILLFLTYKSEFKPFPFAPFPDGEPPGPGLPPDRPAGNGAAAATGTPATPGTAGTVDRPAQASPGAAATGAEVARPDFASEHEPEAAGNVFDDISFTGGAAKAPPGGMPPGGIPDEGDAGQDRHEAPDEGQGSRGGDSDKPPGTP